MGKTRSKEPSGTVRAMRYEILFGKDQKDKRQRWQKIAEQCRMIVNTIWQQWECWHVQRGHEKIVVDFMADFAKWRQEGGERPKLEVKPSPPECTKHIRKVLSERFPDVHSRVRELLQNITLKRLTGKSTDGSWSCWQSILSGRQGRPSTVNDFPIPFDKQSCTPLVEDGKNYKLTIRLTREPREGKAGASIEDEFSIKARGNAATVAKRIMSGEYQFKGSQIIYNRNRRKWFALLCYDMGPPKVPALDIRKTAVLRPSRHVPFQFRFPGGRRTWIAGRGEFVPAIRKKLLTHRWSRREKYKYAANGAKGHGRRRNERNLQPFTKKWTNFCRTLNHTIANRCVKFCLEHDIGKLVYWMPDGGPNAGKLSQKRFLSAAGKVPGRRDSTNWPWSMLEGILRSKCQQHGIQLEVRSYGARSTKTKKRKVG